MPGVTPAKPATPTATPPNTAGNFTVRWAAVTHATRYELQERQGSTGSWTDVYDGAALSKAFTGKTAGEWQYRVRACNGTQCSTPSDTLTVPVPGVTPAKPATPTATTPNTAGNFTVRWAAVTHATRYELQERQGSTGSWTDVYDGAALSKAFTGQAAGEWQYRVLACNGTQCSTPSDTLTVPVPGVTPLSITPSPSTNGSYTVSWQATGSRLQLRERYEDGEWTVVDTYASAVTSKAFTGKQGGTYSYRTYQCSTYITTLCVTPVAGPVSVEVTGPVPAKPATPTSSTPNVFGNFTVRWTAVTHATRYELQERQGEDEWMIQYNGAALSKAFTGKTAGEWQYRVRACNGTQCSAPSEVLMVTVPPSMFVAPSPSTDGSYTVSWSSFLNRCITQPFFGIRECPQLQERVDASRNWRNVSGVGRYASSHDFSDKASGTYHYRLVRTILLTSTTTVLAGPVSVEVMRDPTASVRWDPNPVNYGATSTLIWESSGVTSCLLNGTDRGTSGSWAGTNRIRPSTSTFTCTTANGTLSDDAPLKVRPQVPARPTGPTASTGGLHGALDRGGAGDRLHIARAQGRRELGHV